MILRRNRDTDAKGEFTELTADTGSAATAYTDGSVAAETRYTYRIKAINEHGVSERSRWVHIDTSEPPVQTSPDLTVGSPSVTDSRPETGDSFTLSATVGNGGDGSSAATTLRYYRSTDLTITTSDTSVGTDGVGRLGRLGQQQRVDRPDGAVNGGYLLLRGVRGRGVWRVRHDQQLLRFDSHYRVSMFNVIRLAFSRTFVHPGSAVK